ncbi:MAG TPA: peptide chain release factor N(5)-glutamine methyltransferase [Symbiobacteriaceae bacterium]|nr:peptide chain release factor N(5)-glutamine methyltransferase [Symbiobacteriaceae bacterium]
MNDERGERPAQTDQGALLIGGALSWAVGVLRAAGVEEAEREAGWLLAERLGCSVGTLRARRESSLDPVDWTVFEGWVQRRASREPIQYILGTQEFLGLEFRVTPAVLIPRLDTELLVEVAVAHLRATAGELPDGYGGAVEDLRVADIGTGSGAIAIGVAHLVETAQVVAVDLSPAALAVARANAERLEVADRVEFRQGDLLAPLSGERFAAILSNPPYIPANEMTGLDPEVREFEPHLALTPGGDGLEFYRRLAAGAPGLLRPRGLLAVEVGIGQPEAVSALFTAAGLAVSVHVDTGGIQRVVAGVRLA